MKKPPDTAFLKSGEESKSLGRLSIEIAPGMREVGEVGSAKHQTDHKIVETCHDLCRIAIGDMRSIFV